MTSAQVVETSVNVISNSPSQDYTHPDDRTLLNDMTPGFKPFTILLFQSLSVLWQKAGSIGKPIGPYFSDSNAHLVARESKPSQPHFGYVHDTGRVTCEQCPSFNDWKLCKHTIAATEKMGRLQKVLQWRRSNGTPNLDKAVRASWPG